jgi:hypothetical protein
VVEADLHGRMEESDQEPYERRGAHFVIGQGSVPQPINEALQGVRAGEQRVAERRSRTTTPIRAAPARSSATPSTSRR